MDYAQHLGRFREKQEVQQAMQRQQQDARKVALQIALEDAQDLIRHVLRPELEKLGGALVDAGVRAKVTLGRGQAGETETDYEVEVTLQDESNRYRYLKFEANAERRTFHVSCSTSHQPSDYITETIRYDQVTPQLAEDSCRMFLTKAFPV